MRPLASAMLSGTLARRAELTRRCGPREQVHHGARAFSHWYCERGDLERTASWSPRAEAASYADEDPIDVVPPETSVASAVCNRVEFGRCPATSMPSRSAHLIARVARTKHFLRPPTTADYYRRPTTTAIVQWGVSG
jgi:hypothetical protein